MITPTNLTDKLTNDFFTRSDMPDVPMVVVKRVIAGIAPLIVLKQEAADQVAATVEICRSKVQAVLEAYPTDIFPEPKPGKHGETVDACSTRAARHVARNLLCEFGDEFSNPAEILARRDENIRKERDFLWIRYFPPLEDSSAPGYPESVPGWLKKKNRGVRLAALEEAIKAVETHKVIHGDHYAAYMATSNDSASLAQAIRALMEKPR